MNAMILAEGLIPPFHLQKFLRDPWVNGAWENTMWILLLSVLIGLCCGLVGNFLLLRRMALTGDAISHSVLPGLVLGYVIFDSLDPWVMIGGAAVAGVGAVMLIEMLHQKSRLKTDAATGVAFTTFFALGVLLIRRFANQVHLDVDCVLFGRLEFTVFDTMDTPFGLMPVSVVKLLWITLGCLLLLGLFYKELLITSFDAGLAKALGLASRVIHLGLMTVTSVIVVASLESVGAVLVVGMIIVPPATARLMADRLPTLLILTSVLVVIGSLLGTHLATWLNTPLAASIMAASGAVFFLVWMITWLKKFR